MCEDRYVKCRMCAEDVLVREEERHIAVCPEANLFCPNHCLVAKGRSNEVSLIRRKDLDNHLKSCPKRVVSCDFRDVGCSYEGFEEGIRAHVMRAWPEHVDALRKELVKAKASVEKLTHVADNNSEALVDVKAQLAQVKDELAKLKKTLGKRSRSGDDTTSRKSKVRQISQRLEGDASGITKW